MSLICGCWEPFAFENVAQMASTIAADDLYALHAKRIVDMSSDSSGNRVKIRGPAAARAELVAGLVERGTAGCTIVNTVGRVMFIIFTSVCRLRSFLADDPELLYEGNRFSRYFGIDEICGLVDIPGLSIALQSSSLVLSGYDMLSSARAVELNRDPRNEMSDADFRTVEADGSRVRLALVWSCRLICDGSAGLRGTAVLSKAVGR
jgi:hypothetical protein